MAWWKTILLTTAVLLATVGGVAWYVLTYADLDPYLPVYAAHCGDCHGSELEGTDTGVALMARPLTGGDTVTDIAQSIRNRHPAMGATAFRDTLDDVDVKGLAIFVGERRMGQRFVDFGYYTDFILPGGPIHSEAHSFVLETLIEGMDPLVFSIEPLPDGAWLVTEKERGLSIVSADGVQSAPIEGTPLTGGSFTVRGVHYGLGWLLDVATHPDYADTGWIYLHYTDICPDGCPGGDSGNMLTRTSMNRLDRGRIVDGSWVDVETIWRAAPEHYTVAPDTGAGGRIAFDESGHVYISVGIKETDEGPEVAIGPQQLDKPYGKIHRVNDDGTIPRDNPFADPAWLEGHGAGFTRQTTWTYGHRSPQGLEWNPIRQHIWDSEMGPRGGDEINELLPGRNYGWPFHSRGLEYSMRAVQRHTAHGLEFDADKVVGTLVDITPSPGISSFAFYAGDAFPRWQHNVLIGSLKGRTLYRMVFDGTTLTHRETLIDNLARIRDVEIGYDGLVYLLLENVAGSTIVRLVPTGQQPEQANAGGLRR